MKARFAIALAAAVFVFGPVLAGPVQARGAEAISDEEAGMVCDESTMGYFVDIDFDLYQCDGRDWVRVGSL